MPPPHPLPHRPPTHTRIHTIDFNTPRFSSFGKKPLVWEKPSRNQARRKCEKTETTRPQQKMIEKGETNWDATRRNYQYHPHWNAGNSATAGREAAAVINYWSIVALTSTAHAFLCTSTTWKIQQNFVTNLLFFRNCSRKKHHILTIFIASVAEIRPNFVGISQIRQKMPQCAENLKKTAKELDKS